MAPYYPRYFILISFWPCATRAELFFRSPIRLLNQG